MSNALFYRAYLRNSLGVDWLVGCDEPAEQPMESSNPYIFIAPKSYKGSALEKMMERMMIAIQQTPQTVELRFVDGKTWVDSLNKMLSSKKVMVFGEKLFSGPVGEWQKKGEHYFMVTNDLQAIKKQPLLKKETWKHLQNFVGMKS